MHCCLAAAPSCLSTYLPGQKLSLRWLSLNQSLYDPLAPTSHPTTRYLALQFQRQGAVVARCTGQVTGAPHALGSAVKSCQECPSAANAAIAIECMWAQWKHFILMPRCTRDACRSWSPSHPVSVAPLRLPRAEKQGELKLTATDKACRALTRELIALLLCRRNREDGLPCPTAVRQARSGRRTRRHRHQRDAQRGGQRPREKEC